MILDKTQIEVVESFIVKRDIDFIDIKFELLDHMVCDIEATMEAEDISFEEAFYNTKSKWSYSFRKTDNIWMGLAYIKPKIVIDKCGALMKKTTLYSLFAAIIVTPSIWFLSKTLNFDINLIFSNLHKVRWVLFAVSLVILVYHFWKIKSEKVKTVFGYCYTRQFWLLPLYVIVANPSELNSTSFWSQFLPLAFLVMYLSYYYFAFKIFLEHRKYVKRNFQLT